MFSATAGVFWEKALISVTMHNLLSCKSAVCSEQKCITHPPRRAVDREPQGFSGEAIVSMDIHEHARNTVSNK